MALTDNLVSYWKLDESSDGSSPVTRVDSHGSNDLTDFDNVASTTGVINNGANFVKTNTECLNIADASQSGLDITGDWSISTWTKINSGSSNNFFLCKANGGTGGEGYIVGIDTSNHFRVFIVDSSSNESSAITSATLDVSGSVLYHLVATFKASTGQITLYINASSQSLGTDTTNATGINNNSYPFVLGALSSAAGNSWGGMVDEVGIWSRELTSTEVTELYNSGDGLAYPFTSADNATFFGTNF